ncbi:MAG: hypothetical protein QW728_00155 [Thermoplasmata archaeon]
MAKSIFSELETDLKNLQDKTIKENIDMEKKLSEINRNILEGFLTFAQTMDKTLHKSFLITPPPAEFLNYITPDGNYEFRPEYKFERLSQIAIIDRSLDSSRNGDMINAVYVNEDNQRLLRIVFAYCEGEHYYKYSGWKRIFLERKLYEAPVDKIKFENIWEVLKPLFKVWFDSHLKKNRSTLIEYLNNNFERVSSYTA